MSRRSGRCRSAVPNIWINLGHCEETKECCWCDVSRCAMESLYVFAGIFGFAFFVPKLFVLQALSGCGKCKFLCWISISSLCNSHLYDWKSDRDIPATTRNLSRLGGCLKQNEMDKSCKSRKTGIKGACKEDFNMGIHSLIRTILLEDQKPKSHLSVRIRSVIHTAQHNSSPLVSTV